MTTTWIPLAPSVLIDVGEVEQFYIQGKDVAVWRSAQGRVQIWENRCPHRSVRLSLGYVQEESLVCAYHGWQFAHEDGHCQRIPAQPEQRAPKSLCVKTYQACESADMIWFAESTETAVPLTATMNTTVYAGSLLLEIEPDDLQHALVALGMQPHPDRVGVWQGIADQAGLCLYLSPVTHQQWMLYAMLQQPHAADGIHPVLTQIRQYSAQEQYSHA